MRARRFQDHAPCGAGEGSLVPHGGGHKASWGPVGADQRGRCVRGDVGPAWRGPSAFHPCTPTGTRSGESEGVDVMAETPHGTLERSRPLCPLVGGLRRVRRHRALAILDSTRLLDLAADTPASVAPPWTPAPIPTADQLLRDNLRRRLHGLGRGLSSLADPGGTLRQAGRIAGGMARVLRRARLTDQPQPSHRRRPPAGDRPQPPGCCQANRPRPPRHGQRRAPGRRCRWPAPVAGKPRKPVQALVLRTMAHLPTSAAA